MSLDCGEQSHLTVTGLVDGIPSQTYPYLFPTILCQEFWSQSWKSLSYSRGEGPLSLGYPGLPHPGHGHHESVPWVWKYGQGIPMFSMACLCFSFSFLRCSTHSAEMNK